MNHDRRDSVSTLKKSFGVCVLLVLALTASGASAVPADPDRAAIEKGIDQWLDGFNQADVPQMMAVFSDDLVYMTSGMAGSMNKQQVTQSFIDQFAKYSGNIVGITDEIRVSGRLAFDRGHFTVSMTPKAGGAPLVLSGQFLETWGKEKDGQWRVQRLMNLNDPVKK